LTDIDKQNTTGKYKLNTIQKGNNIKYRKTKLAWFSRFLRHSARKRGGLILKCSRAHTGLQGKKIYNLKAVDTDTEMRSGDWFVTRPLEAQFHLCLFMKLPKPFRSKV